VYFYPGTGKLTEKQKSAKAKAQRII